MLSTFFYQALPEYQQIMEPLAVCLNKLQDESAAYLGMMLPTLTLSRGDSANSINMKLPT